MIGARYFSGSPFEKMAGYARAVLDGDMIYVSGTTGFDPETFDFPQDIESQCENCFAVIRRALAAHGASLDDLITGANFRRQPRRVAANRPDHQAPLHRRPTGEHNGLIRLGRASYTG